MCSLSQASSVLNVSEKYSDQEWEKWMFFFVFLLPSVLFAMQKMAYFWMSGSDMLTEAAPRGSKIKVTTTLYHWSQLPKYNVWGSKTSQTLKIPASSFSQTDLVALCWKFSYWVGFDCASQAWQVFHTFFPLLECLHPLAGGTKLFGKDCSDPEVGIICCHLIRQQIAPAQKLFWFQCETKQVKKQAKFIFPNGLYI